MSGIVKVSASGTVTAKLISAPISDNTRTWVRSRPLPKASTNTPNKIGHQMARLSKGKVDCIIVIFVFASPLNGRTETA